MGKIANTLKMYMLLQARGMMGVGEIAEELDVTPRMVKRYREDLEEANVYIGSVLGRHGGYFLENNMDLKGINITEEELDSLKRASEVIRNGNYHYAAAFDILTSKVLNQKRDFQYVSYYSKGIASSNIVREKKIWGHINHAIEEKRKLKISYAAIGNENLQIQERIIHPYSLFDYKGATYCCGYCELRKQIRFFKLCRIEKDELLKEKFVINTKFNLKKIMDESFGIYNDDSIDIKLKIYYPMSKIVKEKVYSSNQKIENIDDKTIYFEARMKGYTEIRSWIMGMGSLVEVIEPIKLKEDIINEVKKMARIYSEK